MKNKTIRQLTVWSISLFSSGFYQQLMAEENASQYIDALNSISIIVRSNLDSNAGLMALKSELVSSRLALGVANQALFNPEIELEYEKNDETRQQTKSLELRQTIDWGDQQDKRRQLAQYELHKASAEYQIASQQFIKELLSRLSNYHTQEALRKLGKETRHLMDNFREVALSRYRAGDLNQLDFNVASLAYNQAEMDFSEISASAASARESLYAYAEFSSDDMSNIKQFLRNPESELKPVVLNDINNDIDQFLNTLPVIQKQKSQLKIAKAQVSLKRSEQSWNPTIGLKAGKDKEDSVLGLSLNIPLNIRNTYTAEVDLALNNSAMTEYQVHMAYRATRANIVATAERYANLFDIWRSWNMSSNALVNKQLELLKQRWSLDDISASDYLLQLKQVLESKAMGLSIRNQLWQVAFEWMSLTNNLDDWLNINTELSGVNANEK